MTTNAQMPDISPDMQIPVVSRRSLLQAKKEAGRPKDRIDYEELTALAQS